LFKAVVDIVKNVGGLICYKKKSNLQIRVEIMI